MRKLVVLTGILFLVFGMAAVNQVSADTDVTQFDDLTYVLAGSPPPAPDATQLAWWQNGTGVGGEKQETEPGTLTGNIWDLKSFNNVNSGQGLSIVGGFNFQNGETSGGTTYKSGNLFISTTGKPKFGEDSLAQVPGVGGIKNNFGYNYVVIWTINSSPNLDGTYGGSYTVKSIDSNSVLAATAYTSPESFLDTSPWRWVSGGSNGSTGSLIFDPNDPNNFKLTLTGLLGLTEFANAADIWTFFTYECGNDIMVGETVGANIPLPPSALLLGTGLLGLVGLGWRRRQTKV